MITPNRKDLVEEFINRNLTDGSSSLRQGVVSFEYLNNSNYVGEAIHEQKHGNGVYKYSNGDIYLGQWSDDLFHGEGTYLFANGEFFTGKFHRGESIEGIYHYKNGNTYVGQFKEYKKHGFGKLHYLEQQAQYEGEWDCGEKNGVGTYECPEFRYNGSWSAGRKHGKAMLRG